MKVLEWTVLGLWLGSHDIQGVEEGPGYRLFSSTRNRFSIHVSRAAVYSVGSER